LTLFRLCSDILCPAATAAFSQFSGMVRRMAERSFARAQSAEPLSAAAQAADQIIADRSGDARAAVIELIELVAALKRENDKQAASVSRGFSRSEFLQWP
jgi:hypothetical protein